jgi:hypothetical protein
LNKYDSRTMAEAVSRQPLTAEAQVRSRFSPRGICDGQSGIYTKHYIRDKLSDLTCLNT